MSENFDFYEGLKKSDAEAVDILLKAVAKEIQIEDNKTQMINPKKIRHLLSVHKFLKSAVRGSGVKVTYKLCEPYKNTGSITINGKNITFNKPEQLIKAINASANFEVYPKTNGTVEMNFTFYGLTVPIE